MIPLINVYYYGEVNIEYWEWALSVVYVFLLFIFFARRKKMMLKEHPEYKFYVWGMFAKLVGGVAFSMIYFYYYNGGDTIAYFYSAVALRNLAFIDILQFFDVLFGESTIERWSLFTYETGRPYLWLYFDHRTFFVVRLISPIVLLTFNSYLITTLLIASFSYLGAWSCYRTFCSYFPQIRGQLATAFLFMPSVLFWGSGIMKDTITFTAVCWWIHAVDEVFFKRQGQVKNSVIIVLSALMMIVVKPYIFMVLFPVSLLWILYFRIVGIRNVLIKFVLLPFMVVMLIGLSFFVLDRLGEHFDKFALDSALETIRVTQADMVRTDVYGANAFDIGTIENSWSSVFSKFPLAVNAALFRPYIWEARSVVVALSGLENFWVLLVTVFTLLRVGPVFLFRSMGGNPILLMCLTFAFLFAFVVGVTTPNFGALVRFKIPMVPFYIGALYIVNYLAVIKRARTRNALPFDLIEFRRGTAHIPHRTRAERSRTGLPLRRRTAIAS